MKNLILVIFTFMIIMFCSNTFVDVTESQILVGTDDVCALAGNPDYTLVLDTGSAFKQDGGMWSVPVDQSLIIDQEDFTEGMDVLSNLKLVQGTYNGKGNTKAGQSYVGVDNASVSKYMPAMLDTVMVYMDKDATEKKAMTIINPSSLPYITINATKELNRRTQMLENKIEQLEETEIRLNTLQRQLDELEERFNNLNNNDAQAPKAFGVNQEAIQKKISIEAKSELFQNYPNPVTDRTTIPYYISNEVVDAQLIISNILGQQIKKIEITNRGESEISMNLRVSPSAYGTYTYTLIADGQIIASKNMILTK